VSPLERLSVLRTIDALPRGRPVRLLPVTQGGRVDIHSPAMAEPAHLVVVQAANREIGTRQPLAEIAAAQPDATLLVDATAVRCTADLPGHWDALVLEPATWGGPSGIAILACRSSTTWTTTAPASPGDRFPGRIPIALAAAAAMTIPDSAAHQEEEGRIAALADWFVRQIRHTVPKVQVLGSREHRLGHLVSLSMLYVNAEQLVDDLGRRGFSVASGSACTSDTLRPSHVLTAIAALTHGNLRVSLPPGCPAHEVAQLAQAVAELVASQRLAAGVQ